MIVGNRCPFCGALNTVEVDEAAYRSYINEGKLIQDAFPDMSADDREIIKTGICPKCWDDMFK